MQTITSRQALRTELRARRCALTPDQQTQASYGLLRKLMSLPLFLRSKHIAAYWAVDGEINITPIIKQLWKMGKHCYLPVIHPRQRKMWFVEYAAHTTLILNRFKIPEPEHNKAKKFPPHLLDTVLMPLVGFDSHGTRLGMGGGFYDSTFAFKQTQKSPNKPWLIGVAHACQQVDILSTEVWDIPLHRVVTDKDVLICDS